MQKSAIQVLLIEDNPADALLLKASLGDDPLADFQVTVAEKLKQGLSELGNRKFDVLLLDLGLPDSQGMETFEVVHADFPNIPVIVLSGMADELVAQQAVQSGAQDYFVKGESGWHLGPRAIRYAIERHQSRLDMAASEARFSTIFHSSPTSTAITRLSDNIILEVNEAWSQITGYSSTEVVGHRLDAFDLWLHPEDRRQVIMKLQQEGIIRGFEFQMRRASGEIADLLLSAELIELSAEPCMLSMALDITERKQAEKALREGEEKMRSIFRVAPTGIGVVRDRVLLDVNPRVCEMTGYAREELIGQSARILYISQEEFEFVGREKYRQIAEKGTGQVETRWQKKGGDVIDILLASTPIDLKDHSKGVTFTALDITERKQAEDALRQSEDRHRQVSALMSDYVYCGVVFPDGSTKTEWVSGAFERITGYSLEEVNCLEGGFSALVRREDLEAVLQKQPVLLENGTLYTEYRITRKDGETRWLSDYMKYLQEGETGMGKPLIGAARDITEHKQAEEALRESEDKFKYVFDGSVVAKSITDPDGTLHVNHAFCEMIGYSEQEMRDKNWREITHPDDIELNTRETNKVLAGGKQWARFTKRYLHKSGAAIWVDVHTSLRRAADGKPLYFISTLLDITDRKHAEEAIRRSERQMKALLTSLDDIVFEFDADGTYLNIWAADERLLVMPKNEMFGKQVLEVMGEEQGAMFADAIKRVAAGGAPETIEYPLDVIGGQRWFMARVSPILVSDGDEHTVSVLVRDVTERKRVEEQVQVQLRRVRALHEIDRAIGSSLDMRLSLGILLEQALSQLGVDAVCILLFNPSSQTLEHEADRGFRSMSIRKSRVILGQGLPGKVGFDRRTIHVADLDAVQDQILRKDLFQDEKFVEYFGVPLIAKGMLKGVLEIFQRTPLNPDAEWINYLETIGGQAAIAIDNAQLFEGMQRSNLEMIAAYDATIEGWSRAMDLRDRETEGHTLRVTELTVQLAKKMGVSQHEITHMRRGALLHDIGKLGVPDHILNKAAELDRLEWAVMRQHPVYAFNMLLPINYLRPALDIPYCHHEKWDGSGYPRGLKGEEIPLAARLFAVVDVWDALSSDRPYRKSWPDDKIREYIVQESGKHFDPQVVKAFLDNVEEP